MTDNSWEWLIDSNMDVLGLKSDTANMKGWLNSIIERVNAIKDNGEAIKVLFVLNQKVGYVKGVGSYYPEKLYKKLEATVNILLKNRLQNILMDEKTEAN